MGKTPEENQIELGARSAFSQAVLNLLEEKPFQKISASEIIVRSGYSRGSFYKYFENKYDLMRKIIEEEAEYYTGILYGSIGRGETTEVSSDYTYQILLGTFRNVFRKKTLYNFILNREIPDCDAETFCRKVTEIFLNKAQICGKTAPITEGIRTIYYYCNTRLYMSYIRFWAEQNYSVAPEEMAELITVFSREQKEEVLMQRKD